MSLPMRPRVRLNLTPDLLSPPTGYESGGLATFSGGGGGGGGGGECVEETS